MEQIWLTAAGTFIGNALLLSVIFGMWKAQKVREPDDSPGFVALFAVILPLFFIGSTLWLHRDQPVAGAASPQEPALTAPASAPSRS